MYQAQVRGKARDEDEPEKEEDESAKTLPAMKKKDVVTWQKGEMKTSTTKPPVRFTPSTLLAGMKEIHKYVKNQEAKKQLKDVYGIGTEATRATIIDDLIKRKFMKPTGKKKYLVPTPAAYILVDALPDEMTYPDSTAIWEDRLHSMAEGEGTLSEFLAGQIEFTKQLCAKAGHVKMEVTGDNVCPRCGQGVLQQRKGKNGLFWGCSNYPKCRLTCNDKEGQPDMEDAKSRAAGRSFVGSAAAGQARGAAAPVNPAGYGSFSSRRGGAPSAADMAEIDALLAGGELYGAPPARNSWGGFQDKPRYSASPMEQSKKAGTLDKGADKDKYLCPRCREGHLHLHRGKNGPFWGCSNYPRCTATFDDDKGAPLLN